MRFLIAILLSTFGGALPLAQMVPFPGPASQHFPMPVITGLSSTSATVGTSITITGTSFGTSGTVTFNGTAASISSWSSTSIAATVPDSTNGNVTVTTSVGTSNGVSFQIVPHLTSLSATTGYIGDSLTVSGTGFQGSGQVKFGGTVASNISWSSTSIQATVPTTLGAGVKTVTVKAPSSGQTSDNSKSFTVNAPHIGSLDPSNASLYYTTPITITGSGFGDSSSTVIATFNGIEIAVTGNTNSTVSAVLKCNSRGTFNIQVQINGSSSNSISFVCQ